MRTPLRALVMGLAAVLLSCSSEEEPSPYNCLMEESEVSISGETVFGVFVGEVAVYGTTNIPSGSCPERGILIRVLPNGEEAPLALDGLAISMDSPALGTSSVAYTISQAHTHVVGEGIIEVTEFRLPEEEPFGVIAGSLFVDDENATLAGDFIAPFCVDISSDCVSP